MDAGVDNLTELGPEIEGDKVDKLSVKFFAYVAFGDA